uniref:Uncharacterized protein n=1 Tax=Thermus caliditerrae TaxID=1330700 RepID=A0A7C5VIK3_9DEIN
MAEARKPLEKYTRNAFPEERALEAVTYFLDFLRRNLAVEAYVLSEEGFRELLRKSNEHLDEFWALDQDTEIPVRARTFLLEGRGNGVRFSLRNQAGREFATRYGIPREAMQNFVQDLVRLLLRHDLLREVEGGYRIPESTLSWRKGDGTPRLDPLRHRGGIGAAG